MILNIYLCENRKMIKTSTKRTYDMVYDEKKQKKNYELVQ